MNFLKQKINKKRIAFVLSVFVFLVFVFNVNLVNAQTVVGNAITSIGKNVVLTALGVVSEIAFYFLGKIYTAVISGIITISTYNNFINEKSIIEAWVIIRDFCNMFFILILLVIAFATILRIESYNMKKWLPKLLIMAVLINFSRTIAGVIIDFGQVFMMTFVAAIGTNGASISNAVGAHRFATIVSENIDGFATAEYNLASMVIGMVSAVVFVAIATVVLAVFLAILIIRIVMLWIYVVISPLAFLLAAFPGGQKYASRWLDEFTKQVITGPILMFFFWLALITANSFNNSELGSKYGDTMQSVAVCGTGAANFCPDNFLHFFMAIGMLVGGLIITSQAGGAIGSVAGKGMAAINKGKGLALHGASRLSGLDYAKRTGQGYMAMRKSRRDDKIRLSSEKLAGNIGRAKELAAKPVNLVGGGIKTVAWDSWTGKKKADRLNKEIASDKIKLEEEKEKVEEAKKAEIGSSFVGHDSKTYTKKGKDYWVGDLDREAYSSSDFTAKLEKDISTKKTGAEQSQKRHEKYNKIAKYGLGGAGMAVGGALTGGAGWLGFAGMAAGYAAGRGGLPKMSKSISEAGKEDMSLASNIRTKQIASAREEMKSHETDTLTATMDDQTKDMFTRVAAAMELMARGKMSTSEAKEKRGWIRDNMGKGKGNSWNDKKLGYQVDAIIDQNNPGANPRWDLANDSIDDIMKKYDLNRGDAESKQSQARRDISEAYSSGAYSMEKMDTQSLLSSMNQLVTSLKTGNFVKQFKALSSETKKTEIIEKLKETNTKEGNEKLAHITNVEEAYGASESTEKTDFLKKLELKEIEEIMKGSDKNAQALVKAINGSMDKLSTTVKKSLQNGSTKSTAMSKELGV